jgi:hypothetical protein
MNPNFPPAQQQLGGPPTQPRSADVLDGVDAALAQQGHAAGGSDPTKEAERCTYPSITSHVQLAGVVGGDAGDAGDEGEIGMGDEGLQPPSPQPMNPAAGTKVARPAKKPLSAFLQKLRDIVDKSGSLCEWSASGDSLVVTDSSTFAVETLPQYFRTKNFSSFLRQLHFYGFRKTDRGNNAWEFSHAYFLKAKPELINKIQRKNSSSASSKGGSSGESMESKAQRETINHLQGRVDALEGMLNTFSDQMSRLLRVIGSSSASLPLAPAPSGEFREITSSYREMIKHTAAFARLRCVWVCVCV